MPLTWPFLGGAEVSAYEPHHHRDQRVLTSRGGRTAFGVTRRGFRRSQELDTGPTRRVTNDPRISVADQDTDDHAGLVLSLSEIAALRDTVAED